MISKVYHSDTYLQNKRACTPLLFFDTNNTWDGMQCNDRLPNRKVISRITEAFQDLILFKGKAKGQS